MTLRWPWFAAFAIFVACIPLFAVDHYFYGDWPNHLGMIGYFGEYLKAHAAVPAVVHSTQTIGRATTLFYGGVFLPPLGALSAFFGPLGALSIAVVAVLLLQFASVRALVWDLTGDEAAACAAAIIVTWAIYPLTDLYNRAAIPEFFAVTTLQAGSCLWMLYARDPARRERASVGAGLLLTVAAGLHPTTALLGGLTFGAVWVASLLWCPDRVRLVRRSLAIGLGAATVLAPWLYVVTKFRGQLRIVQDNKLLFHPTNLDLASTRLALLPTIGPDKAGVTTPNLDAQISVPILGSLILLSILALAIRGGDQRTRRAFVFAAICAVTAWALFKLSVSEPAWQHLPKSFTIVQFPYRIVALVNVALLGALTGVLGALGRDRAHARASRLVLLGGLGLATAAMGFKVPRCLGPGGGGDAVVHDYVNPPGDWYYGAQDYATPAEFGALPGGPAKQSVKLPVASDHDFAAVGAAHVNVPARTAIRTNVQAFPWNLLTVDGQPVAHEATFVDGYWLATWVDAGEHQVGYEFRPPRAWSALHVMSLLLLTTWTCGWAFGPALARRLSRRREEARALEVGTS
jgi:hypothetical protein